MLFHLANWYLKAKFFNKHAPLQTVLFITDRCNLSCSHCCIYNHQNPISKSYRQIEEELQYAYNLGSRFVDFEGGEPTLWRDGERTLNNLIDLAISIGFYTTTVTTNAQLPFRGLRAHSIWVSMDGVGEYHDAVRGKGSFDKLVANIADCGHNALSINMVIDANNYVNVLDALDFAQTNPNIQSIAFNFYTPFSLNDDPLFLDWDKRCQVIDQIIEKKRSGYAIMNSVSGLKRMKNLNFKKACWLCNYILVDGTRLLECPGSTVGVCEKCGFCMAGEMRSVLNFCPDTLMAGLKLRV